MPCGPKATERPATSSPSASIRCVTETDSSRQWHGERAQLDGHRRGESLRRSLASVADLAGTLGKLGEQTRTLSGEVRDAVVVACHLVQPSRRRSGPGQHVFHAVAVLAGEQLQGRSPLLDCRQAAWIGIDSCGIRREIGSDVGQQVARLGQPVRERSQLGIVGACVIDCATSESHQRDCVTPAGLRIDDQGAVRGLGGGAQRVGMAESLCLRRERDVLARLRLDGLDVLEPVLQGIGLLQALAAARGQLHEQRSGLAQPLVRGPVARQWPCHGGPGVPVQGDPLAGG